MAALLLAAAPVALADAPTSTARDVSGWHTSAFSVWLDVDAGTTTEDELYATRMWMDWESTPHESLWSNEVTSGTCWISYSFVSGHDGSHQCFFYTVGHNDTSGAYEPEAPKSVTVKIDTTDPDVTVSSPPTGWVHDARLLNFTATDPNMPDASGIRYLDVKVDGTTNEWSYGEGTATASHSWEVAAPADGSNDGQHTFEYWATDWIGNESWHSEYSASFSFGVDTQAPTTVASSAVRTARKRIVTLKYRVVDASPNGGTASGKVKVKNSRGKVVKTLTFSGKPVNTRLTSTFFCSLKKGSYRYYVYATDVAGNAQRAPAGSNTLKVR